MREIHVSDITKAIRELQVEDLSAVVVIDSKGNNLYELGQ